MKADLEELVISDDDIYTLSGRDTLYFIAFPSFKQMTLCSIRRRIGMDQEFSKKWSNWSEVEKQQCIDNSIMMEVILFLGLSLPMLPLYLLRAIIVIVRNKSLNKIIRLIKEVTNPEGVTKTSKT